MNTEIALPKGVTEEGSIWSRDGFELDFRIAKQALPKGAAPLYAFGGFTVNGQGWTSEEVDTYIAAYNLTILNNGEICVFEREVGIAKPTPASLPSLATVQANVANEFDLLTQGIDEEE